MPAPRLCLCAVCGGRGSDCYPAMAGGGTRRAHWLHVWRLTIAFVVTLRRVLWPWCACVFGCRRVAVACLQADNSFGAEGAKAVAPELGKLTQLQTLSLAGE